MRQFLALPWHLYFHFRISFVPIFLWSWFKRETAAIHQQVFQSLHTTIKLLIQPYICELMHTCFPFSSERRKRTADNDSKILGEMLLLYVHENATFVLSTESNSMSSLKTQCFTHLSFSSEMDKFSVLVFLARVK